MKVLQINAVFEYSSTGRTTQEMHEFLTKSGIDSYVAAVNIDGDKREFIKIGNGLSQKLHGFLSRVTGLQGYFSYLETKKLISKINKINPDVIHLRNLHANYINLPLLLRYIANKDIATVLTFHDFWFMTGHCCYFIDTNCERWKENCGNCPDMKNWNPSWFFDTSRKSLKDKKTLFRAIPRLAAIGVSDWVTNFFKDSILKDALIKRTIYNWVDTDLFRPQETNVLRKKLRLEGHFVILGVAQNWTATKGLNDFIEIARRLPTYRIVLVGNLIEGKHILPDNIISVGVIKDKEELVRYYAMVDVFFNPTLRETFGKVTIEAQSVGTPVVAYDVTATSELIIEGCGYLTKPHDYDQIVRAIKLIQRNGKSYYSEKCRDFVVKKFSRNVLMEQYISLYKELENKCQK